jgi:hypothetical protein
MKSILLLFALLSLKASAQKTDTLYCRAMFTEPWSTATNKKVRVSKFYVILKDGKPIKFLLRNKRDEAKVDIWDWKLIDAPLLPRDKE